MQGDVVTGPSVLYMLTVLWIAVPVSNSDAASSEMSRACPACRDCTAGSPEMKRSSSCGDERECPSPGPLAFCPAFREVDPGSMQVKGICVDKASGSSAGKPAEASALKTTEYL